MTRKDMPRQLNLFLLSLGFFTRIPVFRWAVYSDEDMAASRRYFAVTGLFLATLLALVHMVFQSWLPVQLNALLLVGMSLLLTGALHEDGLADTADAFGGGVDKAHKLSIMKDSRLGTYGTAALVLLLLTKFTVFSLLIEADQLLLALFIAYPLSRGLAMGHTLKLPYVSQSDSSKSGPVASPLARKDWVVLFITATLGLLTLPITQMALIALVCAIVFVIMHRLMSKQIGGFTGDTLGAAQQIQEITLYAVLLVQI